MNTNQFLQDGNCERACKVGGFDFGDTIYSQLEEGGNCCPRRYEMKIYKIEWIVEYKISVAKLHL